MFWNRTLSAVIAAIAVSLAVPAFAQDAALIDAAKKEGSVTWYTTQIINQFARPAAEAFQKKYGIKVEYIRADSNEVALRLVNEGKAGKVQADVFDGTAAVATLKKENLVLPWVPESAKRLPANAVDKDKYWVATNLYVLTPGFNTDLVPKGTEPKTFQDLLDPKWKGKIAWNSSPTPSGAGGVVGLVLTYMGEEKGTAYLKDLAKQNVAGLQVAARQVLDQVIAGEYPIGLMMFNNHTVISARKGAPSDWVVMEPVPVAFDSLGILKGAPHPNAARLLVEFLLSEEGQTVLKDADYLPASTKVDAMRPGMRPQDGHF